MPVARQQIVTAASFCWRPEELLELGKKRRRRRIAVAAPLFLPPLFFYADDTPTPHSPHHPRHHQPTNPLKNKKLALAAAYVLGLRERLTYWRLPGTFGRPIIGDLPELARGSHLFLQSCAQRYGRVFKVFWGCRPLVVVNDPAAARRVLMRNSNRPAWIIENPLMLGRDRALLRAQRPRRGQARCRSARWRRAPQ